jgi:hypothetical protein
MECPLKCNSNKDYYPDKVLQPKFSLAPDQGGGKKARKSTAQPNLFDHPERQMYILTYLEIFKLLAGKNPPL